MEVYESKDVQIACIYARKSGEEFDRVVVSAKLTLSHWWSAQDRSFDNFLGFMTQADCKERWECPLQ